MDPVTTSGNTPFFSRIIIGLFREWHETTTIIFRQNSDLLMLQQVAHVVTISAR